MFGRMDEDPLSGWLFFLEASRSHKEVAALQEVLHASLDKLAGMLDDPNSKRPLYESGISEFRIGPFRPADVPRAQELFRRVYEARGNGTNWVQQGLLSGIALAADPASIPFWDEVISLSRPRDQFTTKRRNYALAALAYLALAHDEPAAYETLRALARRHPQPEVRALALENLQRAYLAGDRDVPPEVLAEVRAIAGEDTAFLPRFEARRFLAALDEPVPLDNPGGVYAFKVKFRYAKRISRTVELRAEDTLADLNDAIQDALGWDNDHLYSFYLNGKLHDTRYEISRIDRDAGFGMPTLLFPLPGEAPAQPGSLLLFPGVSAPASAGAASPDEEDAEEEGPLLAEDVVIGELGLPLRHKFLYYFDYGDSHEFEVEVVGIRPQAGPGEYPRVVESQGQVPSQYGFDDEEEEEDDE